MPVKCSMAGEIEMPGSTSVLHDSMPDGPTSTTPISVMRSCVALPPVVSRSTKTMERVKLSDRSCASQCLMSMEITDSCLAGACALAGAAAVAVGVYPYRTRARVAWAMAGVARLTGDSAGMPYTSSTNQNSSGTGEVSSTLTTSSVQG